jgi:hypothetical protein
MTPLYFYCVLGSWNVIPSVGVVFVNRKEYAEYDIS